MAGDILSDEELDQLLRRASRTLPVDRAALDDARVRAALASLQHDIECADRETASNWGARPVYRRRWVTLAAATVAVAVLSLVGVERLPGRGAGHTGLPFTVPPAAAAQINRLAHAAAVQAMPAAGEWEYLEIKLENTGAMSIGNTATWPHAPVPAVTVTYMDTQTEQNWYGTDGDTRQRGSTDSFSFATPQDRATYLANKSAFDSSQQLPSGMATGVYEDKFFPSQDSSQPVWAKSPPTDPQTLINEIWDQYLSSYGSGPHPHAGAERPEVLWDALTGMLLASTSARPRATAYSALAYVPYTTVLGSRTDQLGRSGIEISFTHDSTGTIETLIVDPGTGDLLELDRTQKRDSNGLPAGAVISRELFVKRAIVAAAVSLPGGGYQALGDVLQTTTTPALETTAAPTSTTTTTSASDTSTTPGLQTTTGPAPHTTAAP
jgi:hypothetical protein